MPASISTRLDEQEFLELADSYYVTPRPTMSNYHTSRSESTSTISTSNTHLRRPATTPGPRRRPSALIECDDSGRASSQVDELYQYDIVDGQTFSHIVIDPRGLLTASTSMSLESYSETFRTAKEHELGKPTVNTLPPPIQIDPTVPSSTPTKISRPISMASLASGSCFGIVWFPRWNMKGLYHSSGGTGSRLRKQKRFQATQSINGGISGSDHVLSLDPSQSDEEYFVSLPSRGMASASSPLVGLDYDYHLAVEVLINGADVDPKLIL